MFFIPRVGEYSFRKDSLTRGIAALNVIYKWILFVLKTTCVIIEANQEKWPCTISRIYSWSANQFINNPASQVLRTVNWRSRNAAIITVFSEFNSRYIARHYPISRRGRKLIRLGVENQLQINSNECLRTPVNHVSYRQLR